MHEKLSCIILTAVHRPTTHRYNQQIHEAKEVSVILETYKNCDTTPITSHSVINVSSQWEPHPPLAHVKNRDTYDTNAMTQNPRRSLPLKK